MRPEPGGRVNNWRYTIGGIVIAGCIVAGVLYWIGKAAGNAFGWW